MNKFWKRGTAAFLSAVLAVSGAFSYVTVFADENLTVMSKAETMAGPGAPMDGVMQTATTSDASVSVTGADKISEAGTVFGASASDAFFDEDGVLVDGVLLDDIEATGSNALLAELELPDQLIGQVMGEFELEDLEAEFSFDVPLDNDALFAAYVNRAFGMEEAGSHMLRKSVSAYAGLNETEKMLFDCLKADIRAVAEGSRESTEFSYTADQIGTDFYVSVKSLTMENLLDAYHLDFSLVFDALRKDLPYDMYWVAFQGLNYGSNGITQNSEGAYRLGEFHVSFPVASSFRKSQYTADTEKTGAVSSAVSKANDILNMYNDPGISDLKKLVGYRDEIIDLVSYDYDAASQANTYSAQGKNDPWQLIHVFDDDPNTKVVCEGYSKAFKYLCDNTTFNDSSISCYIMTGTFYNSSGSGEGHMWNVLSFGEGDNAVNYLADITHCDNLYEGGGSRAARFLVGVEMASSDSGASGFSIDGRTYDYLQEESDGSPDRSMFILYNESERTLSESHYHFPVELKSADTAGDSAIVTLQGGGTVYPSLVTGEGEATAIAPELEGYRFLGWYSEEAENGDIGRAELLSNSASGTVAVNGECTIIAVYESIAGAKFTLQVNGKNITVNGETVTGVTEYDPGTRITLNYTGDSDGFIQWSTAQGVLLSEDPQYEFTITGNTVIKAESASAASGSSLVRFVTEHGQTIYSGVWTLETAAEKYAVVSQDIPQIAGRTFRNWSMSSSDVISAIRNGTKVITVSPQYDNTGGTCDIYERYTEFNTGNRIRIDGFTAMKYVNQTIGYSHDFYPKEASGYEFYCWAADREGKDVLSYSRNYHYAITGEATIYAVYCKSETVLPNPMPVIHVDADGTSGEGENLRYVYNFRVAVPSGYSVLDMGILYDNKGTYSEADTDQFRMEGGASKASFGQTNPDQCFTARVLDRGHGVVVCGYVQVSSSAFGVQNIYTEILSAGVPVNH